MKIEELEKRKKIHMKNKTENKAGLMVVSDLITDCQCDIEIAENALQMILLGNTGNDEDGMSPQMSIIVLVKEQLKTTRHMLSKINAEIDQ